MDGVLLEQEAGRLLASRGLTLAVAESCTGGLLGHRVTSVSGSTGYFRGGVIAYDNAVKVKQLGVAQSSLDECGAVSETVAGQMARGVRERLESNLGIAVTGVAGPGGGSAEKPVGLVFIGLAGDGFCKVESYKFVGNRLQVKTAASEAALKMLVEHLSD